jgi:hypothetical protein
MAHEHISDASNYWADQLCMVGAAGALGTISLLMWQSDKLAFLAPFFRWAVLFGGIALIGITLLRGWTIWRIAGKTNDHDHHHEHDGPCDHDHNHANCGHEHSHSWVPAKYALILLPVVLYLLGLPHSGFSKEMWDRWAPPSDVSMPTKEVARKAEMVLGFDELSQAQGNPAKQAALEGHVVTLKGMFWPMNNDRAFTLMRLKGKCCAADAIPMRVQIIAPSFVNQFTPREWVSAKGKIEFHKLVGKDKVVPVLIIEDMADIKRIPPEPEVDFS